MPSDASIYGLIRPQQQIAYVPPEERQLRQMRLRQLMGADEMQRMQLEGARGDMARRQSLQDLFARKPNAGPEDVAPIDYLEAERLRKGQLDAGKTQAEIDAKKTETLQKSLQIHRDQLAMVNDPQMAAQWVMAGFNDPALSPILQRFGGPQELIGRIPTEQKAFEEWKLRNGLGLEKFTADLRAREGQAITKRGQDMSADTARRGQDITLRGQNLTDARARQTLEQGRWTNDLERGIQVNSATGETRPITSGGQPLGNKGRPLTESQGRGQMFGTRAATADKILTDLEGQYGRWGLAMKQGAEGTPLVGGQMGTVGNVLLSANQQKAEQAQRDFVNAVLRQESGAVISPSEFENARKQYFPQPGDSDAVVEQKRANRQTAIEGFRVMSGPAGERIEAARAPAQSASGKIKFLGFEK